MSRQQVAALTLTLGLLCFAILAAIVLLRARKAAATNETAAHDETMALYAEIDRLKTLLLSQPQVLVAWPAGANEPEIFGDTGIVVPGAGAGTRARLRHLAGAGGGATDAERRRHAARHGPRLRDDAHQQRRPSARGGRARGGGARRAAPARRQRHRERAHGSGRPPRPADRRRRDAQGAAQFAARPGVGARP